MEYNVGDKVVANRKPPIMTIAEISNKRAMCKWFEDGRRRARIYFLTELWQVTEEEYNNIDSLKIAP